MCLALAGVTKLSLLELSGVGVSYSGSHLLPESVAALPNLQHLVLQVVRARGHPRKQLAQKCEGWLEFAWPEGIFLQQPLTHLKLCGTGTEPVLWGLEALTALQHLELDSNRCTLWDAEVFPCLTRLHLDVATTWPMYGYAPGDLRPLAALTALQHLEMRGLRSAEGLEQLHSLTCLQLCDVEGEVGAADMAALGGGSALTALQRLVLRSVNGEHVEVMQLSLLGGGGANQLTHIDIEGYWLQGSKPPNPQRCTPLTAWLSTTNSAHKIAALAHSPPTFAPLTASSSLQSLRLSICYLGRYWEHADAAGELLTAGGGCWQQMFRPTLQLLALTELQLFNTDPPLCADDLRALVRCCPALQSLNLTGTLPEGALGAELSALADLTALTSLSLSSPDEDACEALASVATRLHSLIIRDPSLITGRGLQQLTALQQLTSLGFAGHFEGGHVSSTVEQQMNDDLGVCCRAIVGTKVRDGSRRARPLRVWEWLRELCQRNNSQPRKEGVRVCSKCAHMAIADWGAGNGS